MPVKNQFHSLKCPIIFRPLLNVKSVTPLDFSVIMEQKVDEILKIIKEITYSLDYYLTVI